MGVSDLANARTCPVCGYRSYVYDPEFRAMVCDECGHWVDDVNDDL